MKIGTLASKSGCSVQTIRFYEKEGLLEPAQRSEGNFRLYDNTALSRLRFIKQCRSLDLSVREIRELLALNSSPDRDCSEVCQIMETHIQRVEQRLAELQHLREQLVALSQRCGRNQTVERCGILHKLHTSDKPAKKS